MKTSTVLIGLGVAGAAAYFFLRGSGQAASPAKKLASLSTTRLSFSRAPIPSAASQPTYSAPAVGSGVSTKDVVSGLAAAGAGAGCAALGAPMLSPLCGAAGAAVGAKAYEYGKDAYDTGARILGRLF